VLGGIGHVSDENWETGRSENWEIGKWGKEKLRRNRRRLKIGKWGKWERGKPRRKEGRAENWEIGKEENFGGKLG
jgi:hypothetical protein